MALCFQDVFVHLGGNAALGGVSGELAAGKITAILGPNGAGKSTLLACLAGLRAPDAGKITLDGQPVAGLAPKARAQSIGFLPQRGEVHWDLRVEALIALGRLPFHQGWGKSEEDAKAIAAAMQASDCAHLAQRGAMGLSGGEQARVLLARVLAGQPKWLLADEPLANLDPGHQLDTLDIFQACARAGMGIGLVLHDLGLAARVADEIILLHQGQLLARGACAAVLSPANLAMAFGVEAHLGLDQAGRPKLEVLGRIRPTS